VGESRPGGVGDRRRGRIRAVLARRCSRERSVRLHGMRAPGDRSPGTTALRGMRRATLGTVRLEPLRAFDAGSLSLKDCGRASRPQSFGPDPPRRGRARSAVPAQKTALSCDSSTSSPFASESWTGAPQCPRCRFGSEPCQAVEASSARLTARPTTIAVGGAGSAHSGTAHFLWRLFRQAFVRGSSRGGCADESHGARRQPGWR
jgi:hypothetical protein